MIMYMYKKILDFKENVKGCPYNYKLRNLYYFFRSRYIGVHHIVTVLEAVLDIFNISVRKLPRALLLFSLVKWVF